MKNFITILIISCLLLATKLSFSQSSNITNTYCGNCYLGWTQSNPLPFKVGGAQIMTLKSTGILDLTVSTQDAKYSLNSNPFLWYKVNTSNLYIGVGAANATIASTNYGLDNTFVGFSAGYNNTNNTTNLNTQQNTFVGSNSGYTNTTGQLNTYLGANTGSDSSNLSNTTAIGANAKVNINNGFVLGTDKTNVGIRTTTPQYALEVRGTVAAEQIIILKHDNTSQNLIAIIEQQQNEIALLKQQMTALQATLTAKN